MKYLLILILLLVCPAAQAETGQYIRALDGDTILVWFRGEKTKIRLVNVDCPELNQPYGNNARDMTHWICDDTIKLDITPKKRDLYGRLLASVRPVYSEGRGQDLSSILIGAGLGWVYYSKDKTLIAIEQECRLAKYGLWMDKKPIPPWEWRKKKHG